jgi:hypothetical protein
VRKESELKNKNKKTMQVHKSPPPLSNKQNALAPAVRRAASLWAALVRLCERMPATEKTFEERTHAPWLMVVLASLVGALQHALSLSLSL